MRAYGERRQVIDAAARSYEQSDYGEVLNNHDNTSIYW